MTFPCEKCGNCCRYVKCSRLKGNLCTVYETRPDICRVDKMAAFYGIPEQEHFKNTKRFCLEIKERLWTQQQRY